MAFSSQNLPLSLSPPVSAALEPQGDRPRLEAQKGQFLLLLCAADSRPPATLSWALDDRVVSWSRPSGSGGLELVLPQVKPEDAGRYTCLAENRLGFLNRTLDLSVQCECNPQGPEARRGEGEGAGAAGGVPELKGTQSHRPTALMIPIPILTRGFFSPSPSNSLTPAGCPANRF